MRSEKDGAVFSESLSVAAEPVLERIINQALSGVFKCIFRNSGGRGGVMNRYFNPVALAQQVTKFGLVEMSFGA